jgi:hypothetical protein
MARLRVQAERLIDAPAERVYSYLANFREHHPHFLPPNFSRFRVEQGGYGAGTVNSFRITSLGRARDYRTDVAEPQPGRVMTETDSRRGVVTTFTVLPEGDRCRVRLETVWPAAPGLAGLFERLVAPFYVRRLYADELDRLNAYARQQAG